MKRSLRRIGFVLGGFVLIAVGAYAGIYTLSGRTMRQTYPVPAVALTIPTDAASIAEGQRLATVRGCFGCHGDQGQGRVMFDMPPIARIVAPNLTDSVRRYGGAALATMIKFGLRPDGHSMLVMPSEAFVQLTDADLARIVAYLQSLPAAEGLGPSLALGPVGHVGVVMGQFRLAADLIAAAVPPPEGADEAASRGRYLARTICAQCHAANLRGSTNPDFTAPSLRLVSVYSAENFTQLVRTGLAIGGRRLATMGPWAQAYLSHLTDAEIADLYAYLHQMQ